MNFWGYEHKAILFSILTLGFAAATIRANTSWMLGPFARPASGNPIIIPQRDAQFDDPVTGQPIQWESLHTFNPAAIARDGRIYILYRAEDNTGEMRIGGHTSRLGIATSKDGLHFSQAATPVFYPAKDSEFEREWPGGVEDPRLVESENGTYVLTYTQYNHKTYDIGIATSKDFIHWQKFGPAFQDASGGKYRDLKYKSAGIVTALKNGRLFAIKVNGKYWMYWGEGTVYLANSRDLIHWYPVEDSRGNLVVALNKRSGHFDSGFPETGPPPILTKQGILMIYNGKNDSQEGDPTIGAGAYSNGEALFDVDNPAKLLQRTDRAIFAPALPFEKTGQYAAGTTFAEGLVYFRKKWFLYYGAADSFVGVATAPYEPSAGQ